MHRGRVKIRLKGFKIERYIIKEIYAVGFPAMVMQAISSVMLLGYNITEAVRPPWASRAKDISLDTVVLWAAGTKTSFCGQPLARLYGNVSKRDGAMAWRITRSQGVANHENLSRPSHPLLKNCASSAT